MQRYEIYANHNYSIITGDEWNIVHSQCKDTKFMRITTGDETAHSMSVLCIHNAKIRNLCESQPTTWKPYALINCAFTMQRYEIYANHNHVFEDYLVECIVHSQCKDTKFMRITTVFFFNEKGDKLCIHNAKIRNLCESQLSLGWWVGRKDCAFTMQRYEIYANHNYAVAVFPPTWIVHSQCKDTKFMRITTPVG